jgi:hypothetical protein
MFNRLVVVCAVFAFVSGVGRAQSSDPQESWLMQNYRFTGPPPPGEIRPTDPVSDLKEIQDTLLSILRKANFAGDYDAALAAAAQAAANAQLLGAMAQHRQPAPRPNPTATPEVKPDAPIYLIAFKDRTIEAASSYWVDRAMLHCITLQGAHEQVRLDLVDRQASNELNRRRNVAFELPEQRLTISSH